MSVRKLSALLSRSVAIRTPDGLVHGTVVDVSTAYGRNRATVVSPDYRPDAIGGPTILAEREVVVDIDRLIVPVGEGRYTAAVQFLASATAVA